MMFVVRSVRCNAPVRAEALRGQCLLESLPDGRCGAGMVAFQRPGQPLQHRHRAVPESRFHASRNAFIAESPEARTGSIGGQAAHGDLKP